MAEYVCDCICGRIDGLAEDDAAETCDACKLGRFITDICKYHHEEVRDAKISCCEARRNGNC
ncbi:MAG: hypothetical protein KBT03_09270 [Bacteroidales bacterium]|nr:hypothetical protein [Candidatus Scybalousia scybalohippi]